MANTNFIDLPRLDVTSVTNANSIFFFAANNGASRFISGADLQSRRSKVNVMKAVLTNSVVVVSGDFIFWDKVDSDPFSMWNTNTTCRFDIPFNGWIQAKLQVDIKRGAAETYLANEIWYNGSLLTQQATFQATWVSTWGSALGDWTMPFTVAEGDYLEAKHWIVAATSSAIHGNLTAFNVRVLALT